MYKARPFFESNRRDKYKEFLSQPFHIGMVGYINFEPLDGVEAMFSGWRGTKMPSWIKYENDDGIIIEFYSEGAPYKITNSKLKIHREFTFPYPKNINDFICDCSRCNVDLQWSEFTLKSNDIVDLVSPEEFKLYINDILERLGKI